MTSTPKIEIRALLEEDVPTAAALYRRCFDDDWAIESLKALMRTPGTWGLVANAPSAVGFILARVIAGEGEILSIGVDPDARRIGIGAALMNATVELSKEHADALFLEVGADNPAAIGLYGKLGFRQVGLRKAYYRRADRSRVDARILRLDMRIHNE